MRAYGHTHVCPQEGLAIIDLLAAAIGNLLCATTFGVQAWPAGLQATLGKGTGMHA